MAATTVTHGVDDSGLSTAKPANPNDGHKFWCTDTKELVVYDAATSTWKPIGPAEAGLYLDGATPGTGAASKAAVLGANGNFAFPGGAILSGGTASGLQFAGSATEKLGFFDAVPIVQPAGTGTTTGFTAGGGTAVTHLSTFTGNTGTTAYMIGDIVKHLKTLGLIDS